jgi:hypothetical protein
VTRAWVLLLPLALSCGDPELTQLFVCYEIDPELVSAGTTTRVCAMDDSGAILTGCDEDTRIQLGSDGQPRSQAIVQSDAERVMIALEGVVNRPGVGETEVRQSIDIPFSPGRVIDVTLRLENACLDRVCPDDETCVDGRCLPVSVANERCYTDHGSAPDPTCLAMDARLARGCTAPSERSE